MKRNIGLRARLIAVQLALCVLAMALFGCGGATPEIKPEKRPDMPLIYKVEKGDATLYLLGSIHAAKQSAYPMNEVIEKAFESSDYLAVECDIAAFASDINMQIAMAEYMVYTDGRKASDIIGTELFERVVDILSQEPGVPTEMLDMFTPYSLASLMQSISAVKAGLSAELGVDMYFLNRAKEKGMEILEIESIEMQLKLLNGFSADVQKHILESYLNAQETLDELNKLYAAWETGNEDQLKKYALIDASEATAIELEYYNALGPARNVGMADVAQRYLEEGKNVFYVVGAMHMIGDEGIVALLEQKGFTVELIG